MDYIRLLNGRLSEIGKGNLAATIPITGTNEISYLAAGIENMRASLSETEHQKQEMKLAQQNLVLGMAHDLRTPLATLLTDLELLKRQEKDRRAFCGRNQSPHPCGIYEPHYQ